MRKCKKTLSILIGILMLTGMLFSMGTPAFAEEANPVVWNDNDAVDGVTITGTDDNLNPLIVSINGTVTVNGTINVSGNVKFVGGTLVRGTDFTTGNMIAVLSGADVEFCDVVVDGNNVVARGYNAFYVNQNGELTISGNTIIRNHCNSTNSGEEGNVAYVAGTMTMNGGIIENNSSYNYGNIYVDNLSYPAKFILNGGIIRNNKLTGASVSYGGAAVYIKYGVFTMNGGSILNNTLETSNESGRGGGIYNTSYGKTYLNGGVIEGNYAKLGSGVYHSSRQGSDAEIYIGGDISIKDDIYLDSQTDVKYTYIVSKIKNVLNLTVNSFAEGRILAEGTSDYTLTEADLAKIKVKDVNGVQYYAKLDEANNRIVMTATDPEYTQYYYVTYYANGATGSVTDNTAYSAGGEAVVRDNSFVKSGYSFTGWNTSADGNGTTCKPGDVIAVTGDIQLYAQWSESASESGLEAVSPYSAKIASDGITQFCYRALKEGASDTAELSNYNYYSDAQGSAGLSQEEVISPAFIKAIHTIDPEADKSFTSFGLTGTTEYKALELLGVQRREKGELGNGTSDMRFITAVDSRILRDATDYGYIIARIDKDCDIAAIRNRAAAIDVNTAGVNRYSCKNTGNNISGDFGNTVFNNTGAGYTPYKYVTAMITGLDPTSTDYALLARFYVVTEDGSTVIYATYDSSYDGCAANYYKLTNPAG